MKLPLDKYHIRIDELKKKITAVNPEKNSLSQENKRLQALIKHA